MRLIDADKLMGKMWDAFNDFYSDTLRVDETEVKMGIRILDNVKKVVDDQPTVDAVPVVHGRWVVKYDETICARFDTCSVCGYALKAIGEGKRMNYCLNCGAKMHG